MDISIINNAGPDSSVQMVCVYIGNEKLSIQRVAVILSHFTVSTAVIIANIVVVIVVQIPGIHCTIAKSFLSSELIILSPNTVDLRFN